jgi:hypothetical protein
MVAKKLAMNAARKTAKRVVKKAAKKVAKRATKKAVKRVAKRAVKRVAKAAAMPKTTVEVFLKRHVGKKAPVTKHFVLKGGKQLNTVRELICELERMSEETFSAHVNSLKNDFSSWVKDVFDMKDLAAEIRKTNTKMEMHHKILKKVYTELEKAAKKGRR